MLTADHVHARRQKGALRLRKLSAEDKSRALDIAKQLVELADAHVGQTRNELFEAWNAVEVSARHRKLGDGLRKLIEDGLEFAVSLDMDPIELRRAVFEHATATKQALKDDEAFDRDAIIAEVATTHSISPEAIDAGLFGDLKGAHVLGKVACKSPVELVRGYDLEQARAVLLRAVRLTARIEGASPDAMRTLFHKLKFRRLLHSIHREPDGSLRIEIDGPFSLFESVTKYGLSLSLALPAITACGRWSIDADIRWGKKRSALTFHLEGSAREDGAAIELRDDVTTLLERFEGRKKKSPWRARISDEVIDLPGVGLCVADLAFLHEETGEEVLLEVMGFWSRDAVWRRVELVEAGMETKVLFAVSSRLRVSEAVLEGELPGALYVYKGTMSPKQIEAKLDALLGLSS